LLTATFTILLVVLLVPVTPMASWFGFDQLPVAYHGWALFTILVYLLCAEYTKKWFYKRVERRSHAGRV